MEDPRYDDKDKDDQLTEDSGDEVKDLVKEFELKYEKIKQKKRKARELEEVHSDEEIQSIVNPQAKPAHKHASSFISKLYETNYKKEASKYQKIDYSKRVFEFPGLADHKPQDIAATNDEIEPLSGQYLRKRYISKASLEHIIKSADPQMKFLKLDKMYAKINRTNNYQEPIYNNWCLVGIVIKKASPKTGKDGTRYIKITIGDFRQTVELMLFGKAFEQYWKLRLGDIVLVLNPAVNKYQFDLGPNASTRTGFTLKLDDSGINSILEVGSAKDYATCTYVKKNEGRRCDEVINKRKTELCEFHLDLKFKSTSNKRMELNGSVHMKSPQKNKQSVFLGGGSNGKSINGFMRSEKSFNEDTTVYSRQSELFKNPDKYHDPKMMLNHVERRRKLADAKANKTLEDKLSRLSNNTTFKNLNLIKENKKRELPDKVLEVKNRGLPNSMLSKIGFDPTVHYHMNGSESPTKQKDKLDRVKELYALSSEKAKNRTLESSREDKRSKVQKWHDNTKSLQSYKKKVDSREINGGPVQSNNTDRKSRIVDEDEEFGYSSDSDIDIEFDTEEMKQAYNNRIQK